MQNTAKPGSHTPLPSSARERPACAARHLLGRAACALSLAAAAALALFVLHLTLQPAPAHAQRLVLHHKPSAEAGKKIYSDGCIACHGADGKGAPPSDTVFTRPHTWPDFTNCSQTTPEPDLEYKAVIVHGGPSWGFVQIMPAFGDLLTEQQIDDLVAYLRSFCQNTRHDPRGELNLPRAIVTEKAFPENELVITSAANTSGLPSWTTDIVDERTVLDARTQLETDVPVKYAILPEGQGGPGPRGGWTEGLGDITTGLKRDMFSSLRTGTILSFQGGVLLPTGDSNRGFGAGTLQFEPFAAFDQLFPENSFIQFEGGADLPWNTAKASRSLFYRTVIGQGIGQDHMLGRLWVPMVEFLARRDFSPGAQTNWDVLPEMQVTLSRRQHIRLAAGWRKPFTDTRNRAAQAEFYLLWDWFDGRFWEGWR